MILRVLAFMKDHEPITFNNRLAQDLQGARNLIIDLKPRTAGGVLKAGDDREVDPRTRNSGFGYLRVLAGERIWVQMWALCAGL